MQTARICYHCTGDSHYPRASLHAKGPRPQTLISSPSILPESLNDKRGAGAELGPCGADGCGEGAGQEEAAGSSWEPALLLLPSPAPVPIFREDAQGYPGPAFSLCSQAGGERGVPPKRSP